MEGQHEIAVEVAPYWNVNIGSAASSALFLIVEVAPYWNVNIVTISLIFITVTVEVAPYWNVNEDEEGYDTLEEA